MNLELRDLRLHSSFQERTYTGFFRQKERRDPVRDSRGWVRCWLLIAKYDSTRLKPDTGMTLSFQVHHRSPATRPLLWKSWLRSVIGDYGCPPRKKDEGNRKSNRGMIFVYVPKHSHSPGQSSLLNGRTQPGRSSSDCECFTCSTPRGNCPGC